MCIYISLSVYIYIYIYIERERDIDMLCLDGVAQGRARAMALEAGDLLDYTVRSILSIL